MPATAKLTVALGVGMLLALTGCIAPSPPKSSGIDGPIERAYIKSGQAGGAVVPNALPGTYDKPVSASVAGSNIGITRY